MQLSAALQEINQKLKANPPLGDFKEIHHVEESDFLACLPELNRAGICDPLAALTFGEGVFLQIFLISVQREIPFFVKTKNPTRLLSEIRETVNAKA